MGRMEQEVRRKMRIGAVQKGILMSIQLAGVLAVMAVAPNTLSLLGRTLNKGSAQRTRSATKRLIEAGYIYLEEKSGKKFLRVTEKGRRYLDRNKSYSITIPKKWDGKWRIVTFDIAQERSVQRTRLRHTLREIGFERLQDSVWVFPYDCEELVTLLKTDFGLGKEVLYIIADSIENDRALRGRFGLKRR